MCLAFSTVISVGNSSVDSLLGCSVVAFIKTLSKNSQPKGCSPERMAWVIPNSKIFFFKFDLASYFIIFRKVKNTRPLGIKSIR